MATSGGLPPLMALIRFGANVSFVVLGCTICLTVIHGYFFLKPLRASLNGLPSSPDHRSHILIVTGVLSSAPVLVWLEDEDDEPPPPAAAATAAPARSGSRAHLHGLGRARSRACVVIRRAPIYP